MKKLLIFTAIIFAVLSFQSCGTYYEYIQLLSTKPVDQNAPITKTNGGILYEDEDCAVFYKFWNKGGNPGFEFYNKTDKIIYIDLSKTFFIKNGTAYDYFKQQTITNTKTSSTATTATQSYGLSATHSYSASISQYYAGNMPMTTLNPLVSSATASKSKLLGAIAMTSITKGLITSNSTSVTTTNNPIISIPPKSSKVICNFSITAQEIIDCNLKYYPEKSSKIEYTIENSPIVFANYITFKVGENSQYKNIENEFYVNEITNYAQQEVTNYVKRTTSVCENILTPDEIKKQQKQQKQLTIYDLYITAGDESSFYNTYEVYSKSKIYTKRTSYYLWAPQYQGYINTNSNTTNSIVTTVESVAKKTTTNTTPTTAKTTTNSTPTTAETTNNSQKSIEVNDTYKKTVTSETPKITQLYSQKKLQKSNIFIAYKEYASQTFNSTKEEDWTKLDKIQQLLKEIIKPKNSNIFSIIENSLSSTQSVDEKADILIKYYSQIK